MSCIISQFQDLRIYFLGELARTPTLLEKVFGTRQRQPRIPLPEMLAVIVLANRAGFSAWKNYIQLMVPLLCTGRNITYERWCYWRARLAPVIQAIALAKIESARPAGNAPVLLVDSTILPVCRIQRERDHKVHRNTASKTRSSLGWHYGLKLHLVTDSRGQIMQVALTTAKVHDIRFLKMEQTQGRLASLATQGMLGVVGDSGYQSKEVALHLKAVTGVELIAKVPKYRYKKAFPNGTPPALRSLFSLRWRIESTIGVLKRSFGLASLSALRCGASLLAVVFGGLLFHSLLSQ